MVSQESRDNSPTVVLNPVLCRVCLTYNTLVFSIESTRYREMFQKHTGTELLMGGGRPDMVCHLCNSQLMRFYKFLEMALSSEIHLTKLHRKDNEFQDISHPNNIYPSNHTLPVESLVPVVTDHNYTCLDITDSIEELPDVAVKIESIDEDANDNSEDKQVETPLDYEVTIIPNTTPEAEEFFEENNKIDIEEQIALQANMQNYNATTNGDEIEDTKQYLAPKDKLEDTNSTITIDNELEIEVTNPNSNKLKTFEETEQYLIPRNKLELDTSDEHELETNRNSKIELKPIEETTQYLTPRNKRIRYKKKLYPIEETKQYLITRNNRKRSKNKLNSIEETQSITPKIKHKNSSVTNNELLIETTNRNPKTKLNPHTLPFVALERIDLKQKTIQLNENKVDVYLHCKKCDYKCLFKAGLEMHEQLHDPRRRYPCNFCSYRFQSTFRLNLHQSQTHQKHQKHYIKCNICKKDFNRSYIRSHMRVHRNTKHICCKICGKKYRHRSSYKDHVRSHTGEKYNCKWCTRTFTDKSNCRKHMLTHAGEPFACYMCDKVFDGKENLMKHVGEHIL